MKLFKYIISWFVMIASIAGVGIGLYFMYEEGYSLPFVILVGFYTVNLFASIIVFIQNRQISGKISWMMLFLIFPFIAQVVFIIFGQRYKGRMPLEKYRSKRTFKFEDKKDIKITDDVTSMLQKQSNISGRGIYSVDTEFYNNGSIGFEKLFEDLEKAKEFILLQYYIIKPGEIFDQLKDILLRKAAEGVEVKFIVDDFGRWAVPWHEIKFLEEKGIRIERFGKVYFPFIDSHNGYRLHRKVTIIDGLVAHTGGVNIADEYANLNKKFGLWMDYQIRLEGEAVKSYSLLFIDDWKHITGEELEIERYIRKTKKIGKSKSVMVEDSPETLEPVIQDSIVSMILNAKEEVILTTPYFVPTPELFAALRSAATSGVKVKILIPGRFDKKAVIVVTKWFAHKLSKYGVEIYQAKQLLIHSKIGLFDKKYAYVGTANLDVRSLYGQWEVIQMLSGEAVEQVKEGMDYYLSFTKKLEEQDLRTSKIRDKLIRFYINLFSSLM